MVQHDDRAISHRQRWERSFEYPNRCDWRCSHDREWCIRRVRNNSVGCCQVEIFVRPMRYKGCHQAHNAQVELCALFTTRNSLKLQGRRKGVFTDSQSSCHIAKVVLTIRHDSRQIPLAARHHHTFPHRGFLHWRFADAGPGVRRATVMGRHPKTFTEADVLTQSNITRAQFRRRVGLCFSDGAPGTTAKIQSCSSGQLVEQCLCGP